MKYLLVGLLLLSFNVSAARFDFDVFFKSGNSEALTSDLKDALESPKVSLVKHIHLYRQSEDTSYIRLSTDSIKHMRELRDSYKGGRLTPLNLWDGFLVRVREYLISPKFVSNMSMKDISVVTYGYFKRPVAYELREDYLNIYRLKIQTDRNVKLFKDIAAGAPSGVGTEQITQAQSLHSTMTSALKEVHPRTLLGVACGQLFCSCYGILGCSATKLACEKLHSSAEAFSCNRKDRKGMCLAGSCQIFKAN